MNLDEGLLNRLVYAKYLFWQGCEILDKSPLLGDGIAVLNFQDATEMILRVTAEYVQAGLKDTVAFDQIITKIEEASENHSKIKVPRRELLNQLNRARTNFKHSGLIPNSADVKRFRANLPDIFAEISLNFLQLDYSAISLADMIRNRRVKNGIKEAEQFLNSEEYEDCLAKTASIFHLIFRTVRDVNPQRELQNLERQIQGVRIAGHGQFEPLGNAGRPLFRVLQEHESQLNILMYGINLSDYRRFDYLTPSATISDYGKAQVHWLPRQNPQVNYENALFCVRFLIDVALLVERNRPPGHIPLESSLRKLKVIEHTHVIDFPDVKKPDRLRELHPGDIIKGYFENYDTDDFYAIVEEEGDYIAFVPKKAIEEIPNPSTTKN